jgi:hypothetical protein
VRTYCHRHPGPDAITFRASGLKTHGAHIAYCRVSTRQQQRFGLGIEAQRAAVERFAAGENLVIIAEFVGAETGKGADALDCRPQLAAALAAARIVNAASWSPSSTGSRARWRSWLG